MLLSIQFDLTERSESIFWLGKKLFTAPLCHCLNTCVSGCGDLMEQIKEPASCVYPPGCAQNNDIITFMCDSFPDSPPISKLTLPKPEYRYRGEDGIHFERLLDEYAKRYSADSLCKSLVFFHFVFGDIISGTGNAPCYETPRNYDDNDEFGSRAFDFDYLRAEFTHKYSESATRYNVEYVEDLGTATLHYLIRHDLTLTKCRNCGRYFVPRNRSDELYCEFPSPQIGEKTCKEYGSTHRWYDKLSEDTALKLCRNIRSAKDMLVRRNPDISAYADNLDRFKSESAEWKRKYKSGECTVDEFISWLNEQKGKKT